MKNQTAIVIAAALLMIMPTISIASKGIEFQHVSLEEGLLKAKESNKPLFIDVFATWCGPCKYLSNNVFTDEELGEFMNEHFICLKLDGEQPDGRSLMMDFDLDSYPTMLFLSPEKKMLKKLVGAVPASTIKDKAEGALDPKSTELYQLQQRYEEGERDRGLLHDLIEEMIEEDESPDAVVAEYLLRYPKLNLKDENEFLVFCLGVEERDHPLTKEFIGSAEQYATLHPEFSQAKMEQIIMKLLSDAIRLEDEEMLQRESAALYDAYVHVFGEDSLEKDELLSVLNEAYAESQ